MSAHINPRSVDNYLSGICSQLEEFYPTVRSVRRSPLIARTLKGAKRRYGVPVNRKLPLTLADLKLVQDSLPHPLSFDDNLFLAQLVDGFHALLRLGELVWPDNKALRRHQKLTLRTSVVIEADYHSYVLRTHKSDRQFEGATIVIRQSSRNPDPHQAFKQYLQRRDQLFPFHSTLWLRSDGSVPTRSWFLRKLRQFVPSTIAGHSMRAGGATSLAAGGVPSHQIQSNWSKRSSLHVRAYLRASPIAKHFLARAQGALGFVLIHFSYPPFPSLLHTSTHHASNVHIGGTCYSDS
ncbi:hypothetical protein C8R48DRAFT_748304 [Suillus tomentosus]|nr:hypothetical protein C8R48DRAFT_748304 [Suillus tomentosus]